MPLPKHDCAASKCGSWPPTVEHMKWLTAFQRDRSARMCDSLERAGIVAVAALGLTAKDMADVETLVEGDPRTNNYALLIRRLINREAKALRESRQQTLDFG